MASSSLVNVCDSAVVSVQEVPINPADALRQMTKMYVYNGRGSFITTYLFSQTDASYNFNKRIFASAILASCVKFGPGRRPILYVSVNTEMKTQLCEFNRTSKAEISYIYWRVLSWSAKMIAISSIFSRYSADKT